MTMDFTEPRRRTAAGPGQRPARLRPMRLVPMCLRLALALIPALLLLPAQVDAAHAADRDSRSLDRAIDRLELQVERLEGARAVKRLQRAFGYYVERGLWNQAADLFAPDGTIELGEDGVYVGRERIRRYLVRLGGDRVGLPYGRLDEHYQLQPVVHVAADGRSARARWRDFGLLGQYKTAAAWEDGVYENTYAVHDGVWMIQSMHLYVNFVAPYASGWARLKAPAPSDGSGRKSRTLNFAGVVEETSPGDWRSEASKAFPPDRPPSGNSVRFPRSDVPPFDYPNPGVTRTCRAPRSAVKNALLERYEHLAQLLCDRDAVENLQRAYGYYVDKDLWDQAAKLFSSHATFEYGQRGVYVGRRHIRRALQLLGPAGPHDGWLDNRMQLQPVVHVAPDGLTAKGRWEGVMQLSRPNADGVWGLGVYENEYVNERGVWRISKLHFYVTALADYDRMWMKGSIPLRGPSAVLPPDRPPTELYRSLPGVYIPPFDYDHPVTGRPIVTTPEPADSILRPQ